jgi:hypothetical protein
VLTKFLLFQVVFLLSGHDYLCARANKDRVRHSFATVLERSEPASVGTVQNSQIPIIKPEASGTGTENSEPEDLVAEYEEDDLISLKRHSESGPYVAIISHVLTFSYFFPYAKERLRPCEHSRHPLYDTSHIRLGVFRL